MFGLVSLPCHVHGSSSFFMNNEKAGLHYCREIGASKYAFTIRNDETEHTNDI